MHGPPHWQFGWTIRRRLVLLAMAILVPLAAFALVVTVQYAQSERDRVRVRALELAERASTRVDQDISSIIAAIDGLATSPALRPGGNMADFRLQAEEIVAGRGFAIILRDTHGQQIINTQVPPGQPLPTNEDPVVVDADRTVLSTGSTEVSDLHRSVPSGKLLVSVEVPVVRAATVDYVLAIEIEPDALSRLLNDQVMPGWLITIIDERGRVVARSREIDRFLGAESLTSLSTVTLDQNGVQIRRSLEGTEVLSAYARSPLTGWRLFVGVPVETVNAPIIRLVMLFFISGGASIATPVVLALLTAPTVSRPITTLVRAADALERGEPLPPVHTSLWEVSEVSAGLASADTSIRTREAAFQASEERFRAAVQAVQGVIWTNDAEGRMVGDQPAWAQLTGQSYDEYQGHGWSAALHPDDVAPTIAAWAVAVRERSPFDFRHRVRRHDGVYRTFSVRAVPVRDEHGDAHAWVGVHTDITEEHQSKALLADQEARLRELNARLRELNARLERRVVETREERDRIWRISTELMLVTRFDGTVVAANPACSATLGWSETELVGRSVLDLVHPDDRDAALGQRDQLLHGAVSFTYQNRYLRKDGNFRWLSWTGVAEVGLFYAIARDTTAEHEAAENLRRTENQLRQSQKMEVVGQLTGGIAHDFNNLLTVVSGNLEMASRRVESDRDLPRLRRNLGAALEGARRAATLTHRLLAFSRQSELRPEVINLNDVLRGMSELIRRTADERIEIEMALDDALCLVEADQNQLENAILNLCVNSRDAMPNGGTLRLQTANCRLGPTAREVSTGELPMGDYAAIRVHDTGTGIPHEIRDRVFEPFFTTKPIGKGTGLGLSQVFGFMSQSSGLAQIDSEPGAGTVVTLLLPRSTRTAQDDRPAEPQPSAERPNYRGRHCLILEDDVMVREFAAAALEEAGFVVHQASDGEAGLALLDRHPEIELLFSDIVLSGGPSGRDIAAIARRRRPDLKILFTTGYGHVAEGWIGQEDNVIAKPFTAPALIAKVGTLFTPDQHQSASQRTESATS